MTHFLRTHINPAQGTLHFVVVECTARRPCRILAKRLRIFAKQKYGSERCTDAARTVATQIYASKS